MKILIVRINYDKITTEVTLDQHKHLDSQLRAKKNSNKKERKMFGFFNVQDCLQFLLWEHLATEASSDENKIQKAIFLNCLFKHQRIVLRQVWCFSDLDNYELTKILSTLRQLQLRLVYKRIYVGIESIQDCFFLH